MREFFISIVSLAFLLLVAMRADAGEAQVANCRVEISGLNEQATLPPALEIDAAIEFCGYSSVAGDSIRLRFLPGDGTEIASVVIYWSSAASPDLYDRYTRPSPNDGVLTLDSAGAWISAVPFGTSGLSEGLYRVRAVITSSSGSVWDDFNGDGSFDDFTFDPSKPHHILMRIDRSVTDLTFTVSPRTIGVGAVVTVTAEPAEECDIDEICCGLLGRNGIPAYVDCDFGLVSFWDPFESGIVTMSHGLWHGPIAARVSDPLGNSSTWVDQSDLNILSEEVMLVYPEWGDPYLPPTIELRARKWSSSAVSVVEFFYGKATGPGISIGTDDSAEGDEFSISWDLNTVPAPECNLHVWITSSDGESPRVRLGLPCDCNCPHQADIEPDGRITALDLTACIDVLFAGRADIQDGICPSPRFDLDCDRFTTVLDLVVLIDHYYLNGVGPCEPCQ